MKNGRLQAEGNEMKGTFPVFIIISCLSFSLSLSLALSLSHTHTYAHRQPTPQKSLHDVHDFLCLLTTFYSIWCPTFCYKFIFFILIGFFSLIVFLLSSISQL